VSFCPSRDTNSSRTIKKQCGFSLASTKHFHSLYKYSPNKLTLETSAYAMATHSLKVALISSALKSLINITTDQVGETLDQSKAYQTKVVCTTEHYGRVGLRSPPKIQIKNLLLCRNPSSGKQQFEVIFVFYFRLI